MRKNLTRRQQEFLSQFLDFDREMEEPVHYVTLAEHLGIGKVTAYEMLRLLEDRGLVRSEYHLPGEGRGPGRSTVLFRPTAEATRLLFDLAGGSPEDEDWDIAKEHILQQLREGKAVGYDGLLTDLLARIPEQRSSLIYLTEMITATLLALGALRDSAEASGLAGRLRRIGLPGEIGLSALGGVSVALSMMERVNRRVSTFLLAQSGKYHTKFSQLGEENRRRLSEFAREAAKIVSS
ncbi:MAG: hypothetical protein KKD28_14850 [Chloroflexi bacterium]|nr:hypothetical protein [Chloroflexota bacterium]MBU1662739.1 hypothetical protein [Chloroflexota bacterium]